MTAFRGRQLGPATTLRLRAQGWAWRTRTVHGNPTIGTRMAGTQAVILSFSFQIYIIIEIDLI